MAQKVKNKKRYGISAERELVKFFWDKGGAAIRIAGSGAIRKPSADIIATLNDIYAIEVKKTKSEFISVKAKQIQELIKFAERMRIQPMIAIKFNKEWYVINPKNLTDIENKKIITIKINNCLKLKDYFLL